MTDKVEAINPETQKLIDAARAEWIKNGLTTCNNNPCNREALEKVVGTLYQRQGKPIPKFYWADSPFAACLAAPLLVSKLLPDIPVIDTVGATKDALTMRDKLRAIQRRLVATILGPNEPITQEFLTDWQKGSQLSFNSRWSGWWCGYMVHCHVLNEHGVLKLEQDVRQHLDLWVELYRHLHMMFVFEDLVVFSERPVHVFRNDNNRLHSVEGSALLYRDGYALYSVNGVRVPEKAVTDPQGYTFEELQNEQNSEVHRVIAERIGWDAYIQKIKAQVVSTFFCEKFKLEYELLESQMPGAGDLQPKYLRMRSPALFDMSQPWYIEPVHPGLLTAEAARRWQFPKTKNTDSKLYRQGDVFVAYADPEDLEWPEVEWCNENPKLDFEVET